VQVTSDCTPPETSIEAGPIGPTNDPDPTFEFSSAGGAEGFECSIDGSPFSSCSSGMSTEVLPDGQHAFAVRARDAVGNVDPTPSARTFTVDTDPPDTFITSGPSSRTKAAPRFTFTADEGSTSFTCHIDPAASQSCNSPFVVPRLAEGPHVFTVSAVDAAGNRDPLPATHNFVMDTRLEPMGLSVRRSQPHRKPLQIRVRVRAAEQAEVLLSGELSGTRHGLERRSVQVTAGKFRRVSLDAPPETSREVRRMLNRGDRVRIRITASGEDAAGNKAVESARVRIRS